MTARQHLVYRVDIGGRVYVGMTRQSLRARMSAHRSDKTSKLGGLLRSGQSGHVRVLHAARTEAEAAEVEVRIIRRLGLANLVNEREDAGAFRFRPGNYPTDGTAICTRCQRRRPVSEMAPDRNRPRGYSSRCRDCYRAYGRLSDWTLRSRGEYDYKLAYRVSKAWIAAGRDPNDLRADTYEAAIAEFG